MSYFYIFLAILLTAYSQITIKQQVLNAGSFPSGFAEKSLFLAQLLLNPWVMSAFLAALIASLFWMAAMTKLPLSHGFPIFISLTFVLVMFFSAAIFHEAMTPLKIVGAALIVAGIVVGSRG